MRILASKSFIAALDLFQKRIKICNYLNLIK
jgi:hypothetical protein